MIKQDKTNHSSKTPLKAIIRLKWHELFPVVCAAALYGALVYTLGINILQQFPNSADEFDYLYQAHTFAAGKVYNPAHPLQEFLSPFFIQEHDGKVFSIFPPGWSLFLMFGVWIDNPWVINPFLASLSFLVFYQIARHFFDTRLSWLALGLWMASPMTLLNNASLFSHTCCSFLILLSILLLLHCHKQLTFINGTAAGLVMGFAICTRELTATSVLCIPLLYVLYSSKHRIRFLVSSAAGLFPVACLYGWYCSQLTGTWFYPPRYLLLDEYLGFGWREIRLFDYVEHQYHGPIEACTVTWNNIILLLSWATAGFPLVAMLGTWFYPANRWMTIFLCSSLMLIFIYSLYPSDGGTQYGARFYFEALPFLTLSTVYTLQQFISTWRQFSRYSSLFATLLLSVILSVQLFFFFSSVHRSVYERRDLFRQIEHKQLKNALVFVASPSGSMTHGDLIRNLPGYSHAPVMYAWNLGQRNQELMAAFPDRKAFLYQSSDQTGFSSLSPIQPHFK